MTDKNDKSLDFSYAKEIERFYEDFPELKGKVFIVDPNKYKSTQDFIDANPEFLATQRKFQRFDHIKNSGVTIEDYKRVIWATFPGASQLDKHYKDGGFCCPILNFADLIAFSKDKKQAQDIEVIYFIMPIKTTPLFNIEFLNCLQESDFNDDCNMEILHKYVLYHEIGHALYNEIKKEKSAQYILDGYSQDAEHIYEGEATAESYALIKLIQEYGVKNPTIEFIIARRTLSRITKDSSAYNFLPSIDKVVEYANVGKLDNLTSKESAQLACQIAEENSLTAEHSKEISVHTHPIYSSLYGGHKLNEFDINRIKKIKTPVVLHDIQYVLNCLEQTTAANPEIKRRVKEAWSALKQNELIKNGQARLKPAWQARKLQAKKPKTINLGPKKFTSHTNSKGPKI